MKQILITLVVVFSIAGVSVAETRVWTLKSGKSIEAQLISIIGGKVALKTPKGKLLKVPTNEMSPEDLVHIELLNPPALNISFSKKARKHIYPPLTPTHEEKGPPPDSYYYSFTTQIKQTSSGAYNQELTVEVFAMAVEVVGDKNILIDYYKQPFHLSEENKRSVTIAGEREPFISSYTLDDGQNQGVRRGQKFAGYMVVVTDARGEVIGYKTTREWWFEKIENLRELPIGKTFDKEGKRCWPTRPKVPGYY